MDKIKWNDESLIYILNIKPYVCACACAKDGPIPLVKNNILGLIQELLN